MRVITFKKNEKDELVLFKDIERHKKVKYKLALQLYANGDHITITDFKCEMI